MHKRLYSILITLYLTWITPLALAASGGGEGHHANPGPGLDLVFREINFLIFVLLLFFLLRRPVRDFFAARALKIRTELEEAGEAYDKVVKENKVITERLAQVEKETESLLIAFREEGELGKKKILDQAREFSAKMKEDAKKIADSELKKAKEQLKETTILLSKELSEQMIHRELTDEDEERLTESYLKRLKSLH